MWLAIMLCFMLFSAKTLGLQDRGSDSDQLAVHYNFLLTPSCLLESTVFPCQDSNICVLTVHLDDLLLLLWNV